MNAEYRACAVVPTLDNPLTVRSVVETIRGHGLDVVLMDDGSAPEGQAACAEIAADGLAHLVRFDVNRGKGAAVMSGFQTALDRGYTHAFQIDADGQHDLDCIPAFLGASREAPQALVVAYPIYDSSVPAARRYGRLITSFWVAIEVGSRTKISDAMLGFRVYPLEATLAIGPVGRGMEFDIEIAVRLVLAGTPTRNLPVGVRYPSSEEGGVSHFRLVQDNLRFSLLHARLCTAGCFRWLKLLALGAPK